MVLIESLHSGAHAAALRLLGAAASRSQSLRPQKTCPEREKSNGASVGLPSHDLVFGSRLPHSQLNASRSGCRSNSITDRASPRRQLLAVDRLQRRNGSGFGTFPSDLAAFLGDAFLRSVQVMQRVANASPPSLSAAIVSRDTTADDSSSGGNGTHSNPMWRSERSLKIEKKMEDTLVFSGSSNKLLADAIAAHLGTRLGRVDLRRFADGEVALQFLDSLRGKDVYIVQPTSTPVNEHLIELLLMISTCRRASARKITAVIPYYGYARQDRKLSSRVPISAADVARLIEAMGVDRVISVDLHCGQIQGFFGPRVPVDNLEAQIIGLDYFAEMKLEKPVIVSPDAGGVYRVKKFQEGLRHRGVDCGIAMLIKQRARPNEIERMDLVGSVSGSDVIIVDDMIDTAGTLVEAARDLRKQGAKRVFAFATHGLFNGPAIDRITNSPIEKVLVTDSIQLSERARSCERVQVLSIGVLLADAIRRIHQKESLEQLFVGRSNSK